MTAPLAPGSEQQVASEFVDLLCRDEQFLRAEFDAIVAAEWPRIPPVRPGAECWGAPVRHDRRRARSPVGQVRLVAHIVRAIRRARQRSPP
jgi:hypothetical protein